MILASDVRTLLSVVCTSQTKVTVWPGIFCGKVRFMLKVPLEMPNTWILLSSRKLSDVPHLLLLQ